MVYPKLGEPSPDRKYMLCYWASYFTERLCSFFHLVFIYFFSVNEIAHFRIASAKYYLDFLKFHLPWSFEIVISFVQPVVVLWLLLHILLYGI